MRNETNSEHQNDVVANHSYALNGKIMLCSVVFFFAAFLVAFCLRSRSRHRRNRRRNLHGGEDSSAAAPQGLDLSVVINLPAFDYSSAARGGAVLKCAVCLSEFRNDEAGRVLPKCEHAFHARCIDTWLRSRSNCPLCRAPVQAHAIVVVREPVEKETKPVTGISSNSKDEHEAVNV